MDTPILRFGPSLVPVASSGWLAVDTWRTSQLIGARSVGFASDARQAAARIAFTGAVAGARWPCQAVRARRD